jgi:hypothetical protein
MFDKKDIEAIPFEKEILLPVLRAQDCIRYSYAEASKFVIYPYVEEDGDKTVLFMEEDLKKKFPKAYKYLLSNRSRLQKRKDSRKEISEKKAWYGLVRFGRHSIFKQPKIISPGEVSGNKFSLDMSGSGFSCARVFAITIFDKNLDIRLLLGLLNSRVVEFYLHSVCPLKAGGYYQYSSDFIDSVPLPNDLDKREKEINEIVKLVEKLLSNNTLKLSDDKDGFIAQNEFVEGNINDLIYKLYDMTSDEIEIIEQLYNKNTPHEGNNNDLLEI